MLAEFTIIGHLGADPKLITTRNGSSLAKFDVASHRSFKKDGNWTDQTDWHRITAFGQRAERVAARLEKGDKVWLRGQISNSSYEKDGRTIYRTDLVVTDYRCLTPSSSEAGAESAA